MNDHRWIVLKEYQTGKPCGMRTWLGDYRADIQKEGNQYIYWLSETFNSGSDVYWTKPRRIDDVFAAMADAEKWLEQINEPEAEDVTNMS